MKKRIISLALVVAMLLCVLPAASAADANPKFSTYYLSLSESIAINFKVTGWTEDCVVTFTKGSEAPVTGVPKVLGDGVAVYTFKNLSPAELAVNIKATLTCGDVEQTINKTVLSYCTAILEGNYSVNMKSLAAELVKFGSAFHTWKNDSSITAINAPASTDVYASDADITLTDHEQKDATISSSVSLNDSVVPFYMLDGAASMKATFEGKDYPLQKEDDKFFFLELDPSDMRKEFTVTAYDANGTEMSKLNTSIESYAAYCNNANNTEAAVTKAMMKYGDAAYAYVTSGNNTVDTTGKVAKEYKFNDTADGVFTMKTGNATWSTAMDKSYGGKVAIEYKIKVDDAAFNPYALFKGVAADGKTDVNIVKVIFKDDKVILATASSTYDTGATYTDDTWYTVTIVADPADHKCDVYLNGALIAGDRDYLGTTDNIYKLYFMREPGANGALDGTVYFDDLIITQIGE